MSKYEPIKESETIVKTRIPALSDAEIEKKMKGMLWKKSGATSEFIPGSFDETIFNGPNEFDPPLDKEKIEVLNDMYTEFDTTYKFLITTVDTAITNFTKNNNLKTAAYVRLHPEWIDLLISYEKLGLPPFSPLLFQGLDVRIVKGTDICAVSDTKDFKLHEDMASVEKATEAHFLGK